eukprot:g2419.t1
MRQGIIDSGAFICFLSAGIMSHETDARHGAYDFYAEQQSAPDDLKHITDENESMAFRRRGYERDALLQAIIERAGYLDLIEVENAQHEQKQPLASLPQELAHFDLANLQDRPIQAQILELLLLHREDRRFTSCVLIHGMGGTGKTVTAVAVLQEAALREFFSDVYWLTVGAESEQQEWHQVLTQAMAEKRRALLVLDDPWMPEQVRFLNPIDGSSTAHRLLLTTRIRDLVPKATRVELPLMGKDEAVALLMELGNINETNYTKENPGSEWPPQAASAIVLECGLLPITLTIAAQVVRSWGEGWEEAVLPLLREKGGASASTVEERVIGAGLQAVDRQEEGAAIKELFYLLAVTHEDFVHPIAVIELLWRSCCASDTQKQQSSLTTRLKIRQWTQLLVEHSLLLGSASEGVHLHDIVLQYLRKRLSAEEMQDCHKKVVEGMIKAAAERTKET